MSQEGYLFSFNIIRYAGYAWIAERFCKQYLAYSKHTGKIFTVLLFFSYIIGNALCFNISYLAGASFIHLMLFGLVLLLFRAEPEKKILAAAILAGCMELTARFIHSGSCFLTLVFYHEGKKEAAIIYNNIEECFLIILQFTAMAAAICFLEKPLSSVLDKKIKRWYLTLAIPLTALIAILDLAEWGATKGIMVRGEDKWNLYYNQLFSHGANLVFSFLGMCAACFYIFSMDRIYMEQKRKEQYQSKVKVYKMLEEQYRQMERLRHDMKNHVIGLQSLLKHKEWEKMENYLQQMAKTSALDESEEATGNKVVNALLYQKRKEAKRKQIRWEADMQVPKDCGIDDFDFCVIIGNILDNAIEACEKLEETSDKFIILRSGIQKCFFVLEAKNSTVLKDTWHITHIGRSNQKSRGTGLLNIQETAQKYSGAVTAEVKHQVFTISVLLPLPEPYVASGEPFETKR